MKQYHISQIEKAVIAFTSHYKNVEPVFVRNMFYDNEFEITPIDSCQAWVLRDKFGNKFLQSYNTIVSIYFADTREILDLGKWSVTTSRHQSKFRRFI